MSLPRTLSLAVAAALPLLAAAADPSGDPLPAGAVARFGTVRFRHGQPAAGLAFSADGKRLLSVGADDSSLSAACLWDASDGRLIQTIRQQFATCAAMSPDGRLVAVGSGVGVVRVCDAATGQEVRKFADIRKAILAVTFTPDGKWLFAASADGAVYDWSTTAWQTSPSIIGRDGPALVLALSADGRRLATLTADHVLRVFDQEGPAGVPHENENYRQEILKLDLPRAVDSLALSPDGAVLFAPGDAGKVRRWDVKSGKELPPLEAGDKPVLRLTLSADGKRLAAACDGMIRVWDVGQTKVLHEIPLAAGDVSALALAPDGKAVAAATNGVLHVWETATGKERVEPAGHTAAVAAVALSPKGDVAATAGEDGTVRIWDAPSGKELRVCEGKGLRPLFLAFTADGAALLSGGAGGEVRVWDVATGRLNRLIGKAEDAAPVCAAVSPDGRTLALADDKGRIRLLDAATGKPGPVLEGHAKRVTCIAFSSDGRVLASAADGEAVRLWDATTGREGIRFPKLTDVTALALGWKGRQLAAGRPDGLIGVWDAGTGAELVRTPGHPGPVAALAFSPDGRLLASAGPDPTPRVWEAATGKQLLAPAGHAGPVRCAAFSADGRTLLSGGDDATAVAWDLTGGATPRDRLTEAELNKLWADLLSDDGPTANRAVWVLAAAPGPAVPFVRDRLGPLLGNDAGRVAKLIAQLDDDDFNVREQASTDLASMGQAVEPVLRKALARPPSSEARIRLEGLLAKLKETTPWVVERQRVLRVLAALERCGSPAARAVLEETAEGAVEDELKAAACDALERMPAPPKP